MSSGFKLSPTSEVHSLRKDAERGGSSSLQVDGSLLLKEMEGTEVYNKKQKHYPKQNHAWDI